MNKSKKFSPEVRHYRLGQRAEAKNMDTKFLEFESVTAVLLMTYAGSVMQEALRMDKLEVTRILRTV